MVWTLPKTWINETLTAPDMNLHIRDNFNALRNPPRYVYQGSANLTTTSTDYTFIDVANINGSITIVPGPGKIEVEFFATVTASTPSTLHFRLFHNGLATMSSLVSIEAGGRYRNIVIKKSLGGVSAGTHNFYMQWHTNTGTATVLGGHYNFAIREVQ